METKAKSSSKDKLRNNEKRKEKSRDAARSRRSRETEIFSDLATSLPLTSEQISQLDKASIMRLAISFLKVRDMVNLIPELPAQTPNQSKSIDQNFLKALDGFLMVISADGDFVYLSENVSDYLGITQIDLMGQNIYEYSHPCDHDEIKEILSGKSQIENSKSFFLRLKCTLTSKGRSVNLKSATYKVLHCIGHMLKIEDEMMGKENQSGQQQMKRCIAAVAQSIPHPSNIETPLPTQTFFTKHSLDMKFTNADDEIMTKVLGYTEEDLLGKSIYDYHHAMDSDTVCSAYKCLFSKGQCETSRYRFLAKCGGYIWVLTQATLINDKMQKPQSVVCIHYVISGVECGHEIYSKTQLASTSSSCCVKKEEIIETTTLATSATTPDNTNDGGVAVVVVKPKRILKEQTIFTNSPSATRDTDEVSNYYETSSSSSSSSSPSASSSPSYVDTEISLPKTTTALPPPLLRCFPQTATSKIFAPRTEDMNTGFLTFSEDEPGRTMLKDEPEDLTHLAPVAGDVCVPLDDQPFLSDMLDEFFLREELLLTSNPDPFISYRSNFNVSPQLLSPNNSNSKHSDCSLPSLSSPSHSLIDEDHHQISPFIALNTEEDSELSLKAPYIPMSMGDDLPLLMSNDLMWSDDVSKTNNDNSNSSCSSSSNASLVVDNSSLAQLLCSSIDKHPLKLANHSNGGSRLKTEEPVFNEFNEKGSFNWNQKLNSSRLSSKEQINRISNKRSHISSYNNVSSSKRTKSDYQKDSNKIPSELLQQLMSNTNNSNNRSSRQKSKNNWLIDSSNKKAACISQPSDSVLMNLLSGTDPMMSKSYNSRDAIKEKAEPNENNIRKNSISLLEPEATMLVSLLDLNQQDYEVNAPLNSSNLLQGADLISALEGGGCI